MRGDLSNSAHRRKSARNLAALVESPNLLEDFAAADAGLLKTLQHESDDLELSLLRYFAAERYNIQFIAWIDAATPVAGQSPVCTSARRRELANANKR